MSLSVFGPHVAVSQVYVALTILRNSHVALSILGVEGNLIGRPGRPLMPSRRRPALMPFAIRAGSAGRRACPIPHTCYDSPCQCWQTWHWHGPPTSRPPLKTSRYPFLWESNRGEEALKRIWSLPLEWLVVVEISSKLQRNCSSWKKRIRLWNVICDEIPLLWICIWLQK